MNKYDLSILIPARNEMFLAKTVENVLQNKRGRTEIIIGLDGQLADPAVPDHEDVTIVYSPVALGQRARTNQLCRLSKAKYVMKLDAHCALDEGFDVKLMADMQDDWTVLPMMYNLHAFDWVCNTCGNRIYQSPTKPCEKCGSKMDREIIWKPRLHKKSTTYRFDKTLHFQYWGALNERQEGDIVESLSAQGSCFMLTREKYWELDICDEKHGSWGQQGVEIALKTWLSGGKLMVNKKTWYAHMFRTQGGDFGFPYPLSGNDVERARKYSRWLWQEHNWDKALPGRNLEWLLNKFYPVPDWHDEKQVEQQLVNNAIAYSQQEESNKGILFYTDNQLKLKIAHRVQKRLKEMNLPITSVSLKPMTLGNNIHIPRERGVETYFTQIVAGLEAMKEEIVFFCEHDVLYHPSHFEFIPPEKNKFYYNQNFWRIRPEVDDFAVHWDANQVSGLVCYREFALEWYKTKLEQVRAGQFDRSYEPGGRNSDISVVFNSTSPNIDIRHGGTLTRSKWSPNDFRDKSTCKNWKETDIHHIPGWEYSDLLCEIRGYY